MFCMCIDRGCVGTWESKVSSVCVLTEGALVHGRVRYNLYEYRQRVGCYRGGYVLLLCVLI